MYKISIIIPTFNAQKDIKRAMDSLLTQTIGFENLEVLLIDDCSTDNTREVINGYAKKYNNIKPIFLEENSGSAGRPRNIGVAEASAPYIMFLDNDDEYIPEACEILYEKITEENINLIVCNTTNLIYSKNDIPSDIAEKPSFKYENVLENPEILFVPTSYGGAMWNKIFNRNFLVSNHIKCLEDLAEDTYFMHRCYYLNPNVLFLTNFSLYNHYFYRFEGDSLTVSLSFSFLKKALKTFVELKNLADSFQNTEIFFNRYCKLYFDELAYFIIISDVSYKEKISLIKEYSYCTKLKKPNIDSKLISIWGNLAYHDKIILTYIYSIILKFLIKLKHLF